MESRSRHRQSSALLRSPSTSKHATVQSAKVKSGCAGTTDLPRKLLLILGGIIICGIPLTVVTTLLINEMNNCGTTTTSTAASATDTTSSALPSQCFSYSTINDSSRNMLVGSGSGLCDNTLLSAWYRFVGYGTKLANIPVNINSCSVAITGWYNGNTPVAGSTVYGTLCMNLNGNLCHPTYSGAIITVTNCNDYFVYYLIRTAGCSRYCTMN